MNQKIKFILADYIIPVEGKIQSPGVIRIEENIISHIGSQELLSLKKPEDGFYELKNTVLFPGFVNAHSHLELTGLGPVPQNSFVDWIANIIQAKNNLSEEKISSGMVLGIQKMLLSGVTTIGDHMSFNAPWEVLTSSPLRGKIFGEVIGVVEDVANDIYSTLKELKKKVEAHSPLFKMHLSPHSVHALHPFVLKKVLEAEEGPFSCHMAESKAEMDYFLHQESELQQFILKRGVGKLHYASSGLDFLSSLNLPLGRLFLIHANYLSPSDLDLVTKFNIGLVHCPGSHQYFTHQNFPLRKYLDMGLTVGLGTDSIASNTHLDFLKEMRIVFEKENISLDELLKMATLNGARVLKMEHEVGSLVPGKKADMAGLSYKPGVSPMESLLNGEVSFLVIDGKIVLETKNLS